MKIAITGATGFVGRALVRHLAANQVHMKCWFRLPDRCSLLADCEEWIEWVPGDLANRPDTVKKFLDGCWAVVHLDFWRPGTDFGVGEGDLVRFAEVNLVGTLRLMQLAEQVGVKKFVFVSTCAVHEKILDDRPLDETHPLWPLTHYGAHKAALEKFVHSFGSGNGFPICAIRPTGIYGVHHPVSTSKWYPLVSKIVAGNDVEVGGGGREVHVNDVARGIDLLLQSDGVNGESYACYDRYISQHHVATIAKELSGSSSVINGAPNTPKREIVTDKLRALGMEFGGEMRLRETVRQLIKACQVS